MAGVTQERVGDLIRKLFEILIAHPEGLQARDPLAALRENVELTEYEKGSLESDQQRFFEEYFNFAAANCVKAGWLVKKRGTWTVTEAGKKAFLEYQEPVDFYRHALDVRIKKRVAVGVVVIAVGFSVVLLISLVVGEVALGGVAQGLGLFALTLVLTLTGGGLFFAYRYRHLKGKKGREDE